MEIIVFKRIIKEGVAIILFHTRILHVYLFIKRFIIGNHPLVLMYHRVLPLDKAGGYDFSHRGMVVSINTFEKQISYLMKHYTVISLDKFLEGKTSSTNTCIITFDDGWLDNYINAFPILRSYRCPVTIFLPTGFIGTTKVFWQEEFICSVTLLKQKGVLEEFIASSSYSHGIGEKLTAISTKNMNGGGLEFDELIETLMSMDDLEVTAILNEIRVFMDKINIRPDVRRWILNWNEIQEMQKYGISFGSHAVTHRILTHINEGDAEVEIFESKHILQHNIGVPVKAFAYPNGDYNLVLESHIISAGYECAISTQVGFFSRNKNFITLGRIGIHEAVSTGIGGRFSYSLFACVVSGIFDDLKRLLVMRPVGN
jgi:peptidoglycan/xylan/chitin deacetylase (PgdA/CDA1 family)